MRPVDEQWIEILRIQALCARYCLTIDTQDGEGWAGCFTEDGAFEFDGWVIRGRPDQPIVAFARPVGFAMPAQIDRDRLPATFGDSGCGPTP